MKKLLAIGGAVALLLTMAGLSSNHTKAATPKNTSFFTLNSQLLYLSNNITITNGSVGVAPFAATTTNATNYWYVGGLSLTNVLAGSNTTPQMFSIVPLSADANGDMQSPSFYFTINNTNVYLPENDNNLFQSTNYFPLIIAPTTASTNAITVTFIRGVGPRYNIQWDRSTTMAVTVSNTATTNYTCVTNALPQFIGGTNLAQWVTIYTISSITGTGPGNIISGAGCFQYVP